MKNTMLTTHLTDMLLQVEICLLLLIYNEQSVCISNQRLLKSVEEGELCISVCCLCLKERGKLLVPSMFVVKNAVRTGLSSLIVQYCVGHVIYRTETYLRCFLIPVMKNGLPVDAGKLFSTSLAVSLFLKWIK